MVRGTPTDAELAALTVVLAAASAGGGDAPVRRRDRWSDPVARLRAPLTPGPGAWAGTYLPR
nr:acyl-CoA carboxylase epsilon subunit [Pseudonocardia broussonetiae]